MRPRTWFLVVATVLMAHLLLGMLVFRQQALDFYPKRRALEIEERAAAASRPPPLKPNFSAAERTEIDPATGERVRHQEYTVSTELYRPPETARGGGD